MSLSAQHVTELNSSRISQELIDQRGYRTVTAEERGELADMGIPSWALKSDDAFPGLLIPMYRLGAELVAHQFKPAVPQLARGGKTVKYISAAKTGNRLDAHPAMAEKIRDVAVPLWFTEGVKKADSLANQGVAAVALTGVWNWKGASGTVADFEDVPLKGRTVVVCFDADTRHKRAVMLAMRRFGGWLSSKGAEAVHYLIVPEKTPDGVEVKGVDDWFAAGGTLAGLSEHATSRPPLDGAKDAKFTDAFLVEALVEERLNGRYVWAQGLGWLVYGGGRWKECSDVEVTEEARLWAQDQWRDTLTEQAADPSRDLKTQIEGWRQVLGKARLRALVDLARGVSGILTDPNAFDADPDLLGCPNGVVDLRTGDLLAPDPSFLMTKCTGVPYRRGASNADFTKALDALPTELHDWYQERMGQAFTGHMTSDHRMLIQQGGGENGKSTLNTLFSKAAGSYYVLVSHRVLTGDSHQHPTELMEFRGARYAVMEETPEARRLNVQQLRQVVGTPQITARKIARDPVTFTASHSLFINTNFTPVVAETDHGTWRRLALVCFPYRFRKPDEPLERPTDRTGDQGLALRCGSLDGPAEAALAWAVQGAVRWYSAEGDEGTLAPLPGSVKTDTLTWRQGGDEAAQFAIERLEFGAAYQEVSADMLAAFNGWLSDSDPAARMWGARLFKTRLEGYAFEYGHNVVCKDIRSRNGVKKTWVGVRLRKGSSPFTDGQITPDEDHVADVAAFGADLKMTPITGVDTECRNIRNTQVSSMIKSEVETCTTAFVQEPEKVVCNPAPLGFDLEGARADSLFNGAHPGDFVRLAGWMSGSSTSTGDPADLVAALEAAPEIYGHNILGFDLLAMARHYGADYDALAAKAVDTLVLARLKEPPMARHGTAAGHYGLDAVAKRLGHTGKSDDLSALATEYGTAAGFKGKEAELEGYALIDRADPRYTAYLEGDLEATAFVHRELTAGGLSDYARREMKVIALQHRMTLNGWRVDEPLLAERVAEEDRSREAAVGALEAFYGLPTTLASGAPSKSPWATDGGREALVEAFRRAGAPHVPVTKTGKLMLGKEALGEETYIDHQGKQRPGMLNPRAYGDNDEVRAICGLILQASGATAKYAEILRYVVDGRVHAGIGEDQASGRWAMTRPSLTNLGKRGGKVIQRAPFLPDEGHVLLAADMDQVDMRGIAGLCQDPAYMALFAPGRDVHSEIAQAVFGRSDGDFRERAKRYGHGYNYGKGMKSMIAEGMDPHLVHQFFESMESRFPGMMAYRQDVRAKGAAGEMLDNGFGRMMRCDPSRAYTQAPALMGQGAARDLMAEGLLRMVQRAPEMTTMLRAVVHDEVVVSVPADCAEHYAAVIKDALTFEWRGVPITCGVSKPGVNWADCYSKD